MLLRIEPEEISLGTDSTKVPLLIVVPLHMDVEPNFDFKSLGTHGTEVEGGLSVVVSIPMNFEPRLSLEPHPTLLTRHVHSRLLVESLMMSEREFGAE